jgi:hypothetical protein
MAYPGFGMMHNQQMPMYPMMPQMQPYMQFNPYAMMQ